MPRYCLGMVALSTGERIVHRIGDGCSLIPKADSRLDLGPQPDDESAMREAARHFETIDGCPDCMAECNERATKDAINAAVAAIITVGNM